MEKLILLGQIYLVGYLVAFIIFSTLEKKEIIKASKEMMEKENFNEIITLNLVIIISTIISSLGSWYIVMCYIQDTIVRLYNRNSEEDKK